MRADGAQHSRGDQPSPLKPEALRLSVVQNEDQARGHVRLAGTHGDEAADPPPPGRAVARTADPRPDFSIKKDRIFLGGATRAPRRDPSVCILPQRRNRMISSRTGIRGSVLSKN